MRYYFLWLFNTTSLVIFPHTKYHSIFGIRGTICLLGVSTDVNTVKTVECFSAKVLFLFEWRAARRRPRVLYGDVHHAVTSPPCTTKLTPPTLQRLGYDLVGSVYRRRSASRRYTPILPPKLFSVRFRPLMGQWVILCQSCSITKTPMDWAHIDINLSDRSANYNVTDAAQLLNMSESQHGWESWQQFHFCPGTGRIRWCWQPNTF